MENKIDLDQIRIGQFTVNLGYLIEMMEQGIIDLYSGHPYEDEWDDIQESQVIETLLLGIPSQSFYFIDYGPVWEVVDGLRRLRTIQRFVIDKDLELTELKFLGEYEGKTFDGLGRKERRVISGSKIQYCLINEQIPIEIKKYIYGIFANILVE